ncbi:MAG: DNA/RNA non-specific endonuclease [Lachnospiraceae bacterium]|jgi:hypothetical protein
MKTSVKNKRLLALIPGTVIFLLTLTIGWGCAGTARDVLGAIVAVLEGYEAEETSEGIEDAAVGTCEKTEEPTAGISKITEVAADRSSEVTDNAAVGASEKFNIDNINIPAYSGKPVVQINNNVPFFTEDEIVTKPYISLSELDSLGRCGSNIMCADEPGIQEGERENISDIKPSGWHSGGFYQRSHLLMWKLSGCNDRRNLIAGTDTFNQEAMLEYEERVTAYLWRNEKNHVMYRVSPLFEGDNLIATGVLMEACSVEDSGKGLSYCVFVYNVEPGYKINYKNGDYLK